jgi:hypothetical protein
VPPPAAWHADAKPARAHAHAFVAQHAASPRARAPHLARALCRGGRLGLLRAPRRGAIARAQEFLALVHEVEHAYELLLRVRRGTVAQGRCEGAHVLWQ